MTLGTDQLDAWGRTITECDELYREVQLLVRINPEAYTVDSDALAVVAAANSDGREDGGLLHPIVFARRWAWYLAAENRSIPPLTNAWVPLIRYISAHLQYLGRDDREWFADDLRRVRGLLGALVNENGLSQGEEVMLAALKGRDARAKLRAWARTSDKHMTRHELSTIFPELDKLDWQALRMRKVRCSDEIPARMYPASWAASRGATFDTTPVSGAAEEYVDVMNAHERWMSLDDLDADSVYLDEHSGTLADARRGKRQTQEASDGM